MSVPMASITSILNFKSTPIEMILVSGKYPALMMSVSIDTGPSGIFATSSCKRSVKHCAKPKCTQTPKRNEKTRIPVLLIAHMQLVSFPVYASRTSQCNAIWTAWQIASSTITERHAIDGHIKV